MTDTATVPTEYVDEETAVEAGAAFLDIRNPGWASKINKDALIMTSTDTCIIGQLYDGGFLAGIAQLGLEEGQDELLGFDVFGYDNMFPRYNTLTRLWKAEITKRLPA